MDQGIILNGARHVLDESGRRGWATPAEWDEEGGSLLPPPQESGAWASSSVASPLASVYASCNRMGRPSVGASLEERRAAAMLRVINLRVGTRGRLGPRRAPGELRVQPGGAPTTGSWTSPRRSVRLGCEVPASYNTRVAASARLRRAPENTARWVSTASADACGGSTVRPNIRSKPERLSCPLAVDLRRCARLGA